jgi:hypothetical protein
VTSSTSISWEFLEDYFVAIDNPKEAFEQQYMREEEKTPLELTVFTGKLAFPKAALPLEIFSKVADRFTRVTMSLVIRSNL